MRETAQRPRPGLRIAGRGSRWSATRCGGSPSSMPPWSATTRELRRRPGSPGPGRARADGGDARRVAVRAEPDGLPRRRCRLHRAAGRRRRIGRRRGYRMDVEAASRAGARPAAAARAGMGAGTVPGLSRLAGRSHDRGGVRAGRAFLALASAAARPGRSRSCRAGAVNGAAGTLTVPPGPGPSLHQPFGNPQVVRDLADPVAAGEPLSCLQPQQLTPPLPGRGLPARCAYRIPASPHTPAASRRHDLSSTSSFLVKSWSAVVMAVARTEGA